MKKQSVIKFLLSGLFFFFILLLPVSAFAASYTNSTSNNVTLYVDYGANVTVKTVTIDGSGTLISYELYNAAGTSLYNYVGSPLVLPSARTPWSSDTLVRYLRLTIAPGAVLTSVATKNNAGTVTSTKPGSDFDQNPPVVIAPDSIPPAAPSGLSAANGIEQVTLSWTANAETDLKEYKVYKDGAYLDTVAKPAVSYTVTGLVNGTNYSFQITAVDHSGNESAKSLAVTGRPIAAPDTVPPSAPTGIKAVDGGFKATVSWNVNTESDLAGYNVYQDGTKANSLLITDTTYVVTGLQPATVYSYTVTAVDNSGNESIPSVSVNMLTAEAPEAPTLSATGSDSKVNLSWSAVPGVEEYNVYRDNAQLATVTDTKYLDTQVENNQVYTYQVSAVVTGIEGKRSEKIKVRPGNMISFEPGGASDGLGAGVLDVIQTGWNFAKKYGLYIAAILGVIFAPTILSFFIWIMGMSKKKPEQTKTQPKGKREPLSPEEKEERSRQRKLNKARDDKYDHLTRLGRISERDDWAKRVGYHTVSERRRIGKKAQTPATGGNGIKVSRTTRETRGGRKPRGGR